MEEEDSLHWKDVGSGRTGVRGSDTPEGFNMDICGG
jgi:hypothetical protein